MYRWFLAVLVFALLATSSIVVPGAEGQQELEVIVFAPFNAASVGIFDPRDDTFSLGDGVSASTEKFRGAVLLDDNTVLFVPSDYPNIGLYDPFTDTFTDGVAHGEISDDAFSGGVLLPDGDVILVPRHANNIIRYDPDTDSIVTKVAHGAGVLRAFSGGVLLGDGRVLLVPRNHDSIGLFDPDTNTYSDGPTHGEGLGAFADGAVKPGVSGEVVLNPISASNYGIFDPSDDTYTTGPARPGSSLVGITPVGDILVSAPFGASNVVRYDPSDDTAVNGAAHGQTTPAYNRPDLDQDGRVVFTPSSADVIGLYDADTDTFTEGPAHGQGAGAYNGAASAFTVAEPTSLPPGWDSPESGTDPVFTFPGGGSPRGISTTAMRDGSEWFITVGSEDASTSQVNLLRSTDNFASFSTNTLTEINGEINVGGMSFNTERVVGCWTEQRSGQGARMQLHATVGGGNATRSFTTTNEPTSASLCSTGQIRDKVSQSLEDIVVMWSVDDGSSKWLPTGSSSTLNRGQGVELPGSSAFGTDLVMLLQGENEDARISARALIISVGETTDPVERSQVHAVRIASLQSNRLHAIHTPVSARVQDDFVAGDVAISSLVHGLFMWHDQHRNEIRIAQPQGLTGTLDESTAFNMTENVVWLRLVSAGQGGYAGVLTTAIGNVYAFETQDGGASWELDLIANDAVVPTEQRFTADAFFDAEQELFAIVWSTNTGVRIASKTTTPAIKAIDASRSVREVQFDDRVGPAETFIGVDIASVAEQLGLTSTMFRGFIALLIFSAFTVILFAFIGRFDYSIGLAGGTVLPMLFGFGLIDAWIFLILLLGASLLFVTSFTRRRGDAV